MAAGIFAPLISGGLSLLGGFGAKQSAEKQAKQQAINDAAARKYNEQAQHNVNMMNKELGERLLVEPVSETETTSTTGSLKRLQTGSVSTDTVQGQDNYSFVDVKGMMQAAQDAGFNPVTWLNAGGMQAYTQTGSRGFSSTATSQTDFSEDIDDRVVTSKKDYIGKNAAAAYALMSPEAALTTASQAVNIPSELSILADAGKAAFNTYQNAAARQQSQDFQKSLLGLQLAAIQRAKTGNDGFGLTDADFLGPSITRAPTYGGISSPGAGGFQGTPSYSTNGSLTTSGEPASVSGGLSPDYNVDGTPMPPEKPDSYRAPPKQEYFDPNKTGMDYKAPEVVNPWQVVFPSYKQHPGWPSGQTVEDQIGEGPFSWLYAPITLTNNAAYSLTGHGFENPVGMAKQSAQNLVETIGQAGQAVERARAAIPAKLYDMGFRNPFFAAAGEPISIRPFIEESARTVNPDSSIKAGPR